MQLLINGQAFTAAKRNANTFGSCLTGMLSTWRHVAYGAVRTDYLLCRQKPIHQMTQVPLLCVVVVDYRDEYYEYSNGKPQWKPPSSFNSINTPLKPELVGAGSRWAQPNWLPLLPHDSDCAAPHSCYQVQMRARICTWSQGCGCCSVCLHGAVCLLSCVVVYVSFLLIRLSALIKVSHFCMYCICLDVDFTQNCYENGNSH